MDVTKDVSRNTESILSAIENAAAQEADILLTPEGSLSGYTPHFDPAEVSESLDRVRQRAQSRNCGLALGTCHVEDDERCFNQIRFYEKDGTYLGFHSKILRCGSMEAEPKGEINDYATTDLKTFSFQGVTVGGLICNDFWANPACTPMPDPHLTHQLSELGAQIIFQPVNGGRNGSPWSREVIWPFHETNLRMRTRKANLWTVVADSATPQDRPCSCPSGVIGPNGEWQSQAPDQGEFQFVYEIELSVA